MREICPSGFEVIAPDIDEKAIRDSNPQLLTAKIAMAKWEALKGRVGDDAVVITADQVVVCRGIIREKPESVALARLYLRSYQDDPAVCVTAVHVGNTRTGWTSLALDSATVWFKGLTDEAIELLIEEGTIMTCAGGFAAGQPFFDPYVARIDGERESAMGLPRALTLAHLATARASR
jgi:septum formation protein